MQKKTVAYLTKHEECNISDDQNDGMRAQIHLFPSKFINYLNFQQNCQKIRQRRNKKINEVFQLTDTILQNLKQQEKEKDISAKEVKRSSTDNTKQIYYKGSIIKGSLKKRLLDGDAEIVYENGAKFKGVFKNGKMRTGKFEFKNGYEYWGQLQGKKFIGKGTLKCPNGTLITGVWNGDQLVGKAEIDYHSGDVYYGDVKNYQKHGEGYLFFKSGNRFSGNFQNGEITGKGIYFRTDGTFKKGYWKNGQLVRTNLYQQAKNKGQAEQIEDYEYLSISEAQNNFQADQIIIPNLSNEPKETCQYKKTGEQM